MTNFDNGRELFTKKLQVFISSKMRRNVLRRERKAARRAIMAVPFCTPWGWEDAGYPNSFPPMDLCLAEVRKSLALVLILGSDLTIDTCREFKEANSKHRIVLNKRCIKTKNAKQFLNKLRKRKVLTYRDFNNVSELKSWIIKSLTEWFNPIESIKWWSEARILNQVPYPDPRIHKVVIRDRHSRGR